MLKNYLKIAIRNLFHSKIFSIINITGLAVGLASSFIILLYVVHELSYDRYNKKLDDIYLVTTDIKEFNWKESSTPYLLGPLLKEQYPEVKKFARRVLFRTVIKYNNNILNKGFCTYADPDIFNILTLPIVKGNIKEFFENKNSIILSRETARKFFGNSNPIGKILTIQNQGGSYEVKVACIMEDIPQTSTFQSGIVLPVSLVEKGLNKFWSIIEKNPIESHSLLLVNTYLLLNSGNEANKLEYKLAQFTNNYSNKDRMLQFHLLPVRDIYFRTAGMANNRFPTGNISDVYIYSIIGLLILLIACINIIIINTGRAGTRAKEIGVRKVIGAGRSHLIKQILTESILVTLLSLPIAVVLVELFLPSLSILLGKELPVDYFHNLQFIFMFAGVTILVGILSGGYISLFISKLRPIDILRNKITVGSGKTIFREVMIAIQMIIFIGLIIAFVTINKQINYFHNKDMGFNKNNLIAFYSSGMNNDELENNFEAMKNELKTDPDIIAVSGGFEIPPTDGRGIFLMPNKLDPSKKITVEGLSVDKDFIEVMGMKIIQGKSFADLSPGELKNSCIINEEALKQLSIRNPFEETFEKRRVIGVVKDFNMHSLRESVGPMVIEASTKYLNDVVVRAHQSNLAQTIKFVQNVSKKFNKGKPMDYEFFDDRIDELYSNEYKFDKMIGYFTSLAVFIACLGLFGMSLFAGQQRIKEIGIRKVMGASTGDIFYILTKEFIWLTLISTVIAVPISVYFINKWLQNYAYRTSLDISIFVLSGLAALLIAVITVGFQAIKSAVSNPVDSLRNE